MQPVPSEKCEQVVGIPRPKHTHNDLAFPIRDVVSAEVMCGTKVGGVLVAGRRHEGH